MSIIDRVAYVADMFSTFKNPAKEVVLTPWRVVNLQITSTLGGLRFVDQNGLWYGSDGALHKSFKDFDFADPSGLRPDPIWIDPPEGSENIWIDPQTTILDINSKSALYPLLAAANLFYAQRGKLIEKLENENLPLKQRVNEDSLWRRIIERQIFVNCRVSYSRAIAQRVLCGYDKELIANASVIDIIEVRKILKDARLDKFTQNGDLAKGKRNLTEYEISDIWKWIFNPESIGTLIGDGKMTLADERARMILDMAKNDVADKSQPLENNGSEERIVKAFTSFDQLLEAAHEEKPKEGFMAICSNPPYQEQSAAIDASNNSANNVFQHFYSVSTAISQRATLIFPGGRWMQRSKGCESIADEIFSTVNTIDWYPNGDEKGIKKIFLNVGLADGVSIVGYNRSSITDTISLNGISIPRPTGKQIIPLNGSAVNFIKKVSTVYPNVIKESKSSSDPFKLRTNFVELNPTKVIPIDGTPSQFINPMKAWLGNEVPGKAKRVKEYWIDKEELIWNDEKEKMLKRWKIVASQGQVSKRPSTANYFTVDDEHIVGETWSILNNFSTELEADNFCTYLNCNFSRKLLGESRGAKVAGWGSFVPDLQTATNPRTGLVGYESDWTDDDLKKLFEDVLTEDDWKYIEETAIASDPVGAKR